MTLDVDVIEDPAAAVVALDPMRSRLLAELGQPASAATLATRLDLPRQKLNYHLRALERHGLAHVAEQRTSLRFYCYGEQATDTARELEPRWREWLAGLFPPADAAAQAGSA